jgi:nitrite reductase/ring-hydroxylating ferredoxin subunit
MARLELKGACRGCSASLITLKSGIEKTLYEQVPELAGIEVAGLTDPLTSARPRKWLPLLYWFDLKDGEFSKAKVLEEDVLVCVVDQRAFAFKNRCPANRHSLERATLEGLFVRCPCHGYRFDLRSGRVAEEAQKSQPTSGQPSVTALRLEVLPVTLEDGIVKVEI